MQYSNSEYRWKKPTGDSKELQGEPVSYICHHYRTNEYNMGELIKIHILFGTAIDHTGTQNN